MFAASGTLWSRRTNYVIIPRKGKYQQLRREIGEFWLGFQDERMSQTSTKTRIPRTGEKWEIKFFPDRRFRRSTLPRKGSPQDDLDLQIRIFSGCIWD